MKPNNASIWPFAIALVACCASLLACGASAEPPSHAECCPGGHREHCGKHGHKQEGHHGHEGHKQEGHHGHEGHKQEGHHHEDLQGSLKALHEQFAPLWHMPASADRVNKVCQGVAELLSLSAKVSAESQGSRRQAADSLTKNLELLASDCRSDARTEFEARLSSAHDALHTVMKSK